MNTYAFNGKEEIELPNFGIVTPDEIITVSFVINNPLFEEIRAKHETAKKTIKK